MFGFSRSDCSYKLLNYLGYGNFVKSSPSAGNRWWSTSLKYDASSLYTQAYVQNSVVNIFPLLTYQKIYQDFFRWSQWEKANPSSYNVDYYTGVTPQLVSSLPSYDSDYWKSETMFDLKYCNWNKDMLMGVLPNSQFGDVAVLDSDISGPNLISLGNGSKWSSLQTASAVSSNSAPVPLFARDASASNTFPSHDTFMFSHQYL